MSRELYGEVTFLPKESSNSIALSRKVELMETKTKEFIKGANSWVKVRQYVYFGQIRE